jgi:hypothetical protein
VANAKANHLPALALAVIRPALVEAKLLTDKHGHDVVYVVTLAEELRSIEEKIAAMEETLQLVSQQEDDLALGRGRRTPQDGPDAHWIRAQSLALQTSYELFIRALCSPISNRMSAERRPEANVNPGNIRSAVRQVIPSLL